ncbi:hypothetical protein [Microbacterium awajiense]|uniref:hypothetical protein n=1 Tax=Microbacterium awajiense TaxID=415214 RepID=UPI0031D0D30F
MLVILLAVALVAVAGVVAVKVIGAGESAAAPGDGCLVADVRVVADPAVAGALEAVADDLGDSDAGCAQATITVEESAQTAAALAGGTHPEFDVWVPDSAMWPAWASSQAELEGEEAPIVVGDTVATTPVVFAATEETAAALEEQQAGFSSFAAAPVAAVLPDPTTVASSSAALLALQTALAGDARTFTGIVLGLATGVVPTADDALAAASAAPSPTVAVTTEQAVHAFDAAESADLVAVYPADVNAAVSVPFVTAGSASDETLAAVATLSAAVADAEDVLAEFGFRTAEGAPAESSASDTADAASDPVDSVNQAEALRTWQVLTAPSRMLSLNDVSGSMDEPATADLSRIDLFEQAAVRAINSLSSDSSIASWVFSSRRIGGQDWQEVVPMGPLSDPAHKQAMIDAANGLDGLVGGGTGLYDSVLAAVSYMRETYVPGQVNLVLLNTDGFNEDDDGLDLSALLAELEKLHDPANPVAVIAIGYGPDTDQSALEQIAAATDGAAYQALEPTDITTVLVDAVTQRGCRPYCG